VDGTGAGKHHKTEEGKTGLSHWQIEVRSRIDHSFLPDQKETD
jgi:hypothetical protein